MRRRRLPLPLVPRAQNAHYDVVHSYSCRCCALRARLRTRLRTYRNATARAPALALARRAYAGRLFDAARHHLTFSHHLSLTCLPPLTHAFTCRTPHFTTCLPLAAGFLRFWRKGGIDIMERFTARCARDARKRRRNCAYGHGMDMHRHDMA